MDKESLSYILRKIAPASGIIALVILSFFVSWKDVWIRFKEVKGGKSSVSYSFYPFQHNFYCSGNLKTQVDPRLP